MSQNCRLYLISPPSIDLEAFKGAFNEALEGGDVACFQLRLKPASDEEIIKATKALIPIAQAKEVAFLINDRPDLAKQLGTDGVHVGQSDVSYKQARETLGPDAIIGVTCHASKHFSMEAGEAGADYVAFGAFFDTTTKESTANASPDILTWWSDLFEVPCVAIGGITADNCKGLVKAGADFLAISSGIWAHEKGPREAVRLINASINSA